MKKITRLLDYLIIGIVSMSIITFILYPFIKVFIYSFYADGKFTLKGFEFLTDESHLIFNSLFVGVCTTILTTIVSVAIGIFCYGLGNTVKKIISALLMITMISPPFVSSLAYIKLFRSIAYSLIAAFGGSIIGLLLQYYICIRSKNFLKIIDFFATLPYILPGTFFGIGYILAFNKGPLHLTGTAAIVVLNIMFKSLPFSTKVFNTSMKLIDSNEILSAKDLGANEGFVFKDIILPHSVKDFVISLMNNFNSGMTTVGSIIFIVYPARKVLTLVMFDVINSGKYNTASVLALIIILICLGMNLLFLGIARIIRR